MSDRDLNILTLRNKKIEVLQLDDFRGQINWFMELELANP